MRGFKSQRQANDLCPSLRARTTRFASAYTQVSTPNYRLLRGRAFAMWSRVTCA